MKYANIYQLLSLALVLCLTQACSEPDYSAEHTGSEPEVAEVTPSTLGQPPDKAYQTGTAPTPPVQSRFPDEIPHSREVSMQEIMFPQTRRETETCVRFLGIALVAYRETNGDFPTEEEGLAALSYPPERHAETWGWGDGGDRRYAPEGMVDMWGRPYVYKRLDDPEEPFEVRSLGADGVENADDITQQDAVRSMIAEFKAARLEMGRTPLSEPTGE